MTGEVVFSDGIEEAWVDVVTFVPRLVACLLVLVVGYFVARALARVADRMLERLGFDRAVEGGGVDRVLAGSRYDASDLVSGVVFWALFLVVLQMAFGVFGPNPVNRMLEGVVAYLPRVLAAALVLVAAAAVASFLRPVVTSALRGVEWADLAANVVSGAVITVAVFMALDQLRIAPAIVHGLFYAVLATVAGTLIIAVGGGGIAPMRARWERTLRRYDAEKERVIHVRRASGAADPAPTSEAEPVWPRPASDYVSARPSAGDGRPRPGSGRGG